MPCAAGHESCCLWESADDGGASLDESPSAGRVQLKLLSKYIAKELQRPQNSVCLSSLLSPTLNSWNILDLEMITSYPSLPVNVAVISSLKQ